MQATAAGVGLGIAASAAVPAGAALAASGWGHPFEKRILPSRLWGGSYAAYWPTPGPHRGIDYPHAAGTKVYSVRSGTVTFAGTKTSTEWAWAGKHVLVTHANGYRSLYAHLSALDVSTGDSVGLQTLVGRVGNTGGNWGNHLHLEIWTGSNRYDNHTDPYPLVHHAQLALAGSSTEEQDGDVQLQSVGSTSDRTTKQVIAPNTTHWILWGDEGWVSVVNGPALAATGILTINFTAPAGSSGTLQVSPVRVDVNSSGDVTAETSLWSQQIAVNGTTTTGKVPVHVELGSNQRLRFRVITTGGLTATIDKTNFRGSRFFA